LQKGVGQVETLFSIEETARYLKISKPSLYRLMAEQKIIPVKLGGRTLFTEKELTRFVDSLEQPATKSIENGVKKKRPRIKDLMPHEEELMGDEFKTAFEQMEIAIMNARALKWKTTSREVAERYIQILLDIIKQ
jgi:excisionase family DNA binding protein